MPSAPPAPHERPTTQQGRQTARLLRWLPALLWMGVIFWFSAQSHLPSAPSGWLDYGLKKGAHITVYGLLALAFRFALDDGNRLSATQRTRLAFVLTLLYAISDEWHQSFTPRRQPRLMDIGYDTLGALLALACWRLRGQWGTWHRTLAAWRPSTAPER